MILKRISEWQVGISDKNSIEFVSQIHNLHGTRKPFLNLISILFFNKAHRFIFNAHYACSVFHNLKR